MGDTTGGSDWNFGMAMDRIMESAPSIVTCNGAYICSSTTCKHKVPHKIESACVRHHNRACTQFTCIVAIDPRKTTKFNIGDIVYSSELDGNFIVNEITFSSELQEIYYVIVNDEIEESWEFEESELEMVKQAKQNIVKNNFTFEF